jgi:hypothetical protein
MGKISDPEDGKALQNFMICCEMAIAGMALLYAFPHKEYQIGGSTHGLRWDNFTHAVSVNDVVKDVIHVVSKPSTHPCGSSSEGVTQGLSTSHWTRPPALYGRYEDLGVLACGCCNSLSTVIAGDLPSVKASRQQLPTQWVDTLSRCGWVNLHHSWAPHVCACVP